MTLLQSTEQAVELAEIAADARDYVAASRAENTTRVYRTGWVQFIAWCDEHAVTALPASAETVALYVADLAKVAKPATIDARLAAIGAAHRAAGHDSPTKAGGRPPGAPWRAQDPRDCSAPGAPRHGARPAHDA